MFEKVFQRKEKRQVLIHELTHAMLQEAGYKEQDEDFSNAIFYNLASSFN